MAAWLHGAGRKAAGRCNGAHAALSRVHVHSADARGRQPSVVGEHDLHECNNTCARASYQWFWQHWWNTW